MTDDHNYTRFERAQLEALLMRRTGKTRTEVADMCDMALSEHVLGVMGYGVLSLEMWELNADIKRRFAAGLPVDEAECAAVAYAFWSSPISEYYQPKVFA